MSLWRHIVEFFNRMQITVIFPLKGKNTWIESKACIKIVMIYLIRYYWINSNTIIQLVKMEINPFLQEKSLLQKNGCQNLLPW